MYFSPNKREMRNEGADEDDTILAIEGTIIKQVTETKFLGVTIDDKLSWKPHIEILNKKLKRFKTPWQQQSARPAFHPRLFRAQLHQPPHQPSLTQHRAPATRHPEPRPPRHAVGAPPPAPIVSANISGLQSNRTVTRDIRKDEFKQIMKQQELTNKYLQQLVELKEELVKLKRRKYELEYGFNIMGEPNE